MAFGETATQFDLRDDNLLITGDGQVLVCDWLALAAPWVDLVGLLVNVHGDGLDAEATLAGHPLARGVESTVNNASPCLPVTEASARPASVNAPGCAPIRAWWRQGRSRGWRYVCIP